MTRQVAKVICNAEYRVVGQYDGKRVSAPYSIYRYEYGHRKKIRECWSIHEALGVLANELIQF